ncbi:hypothetical protein Tco_0182574, partial [Tanacetum coccineum]
LKSSSIVTYTSISFDSDLPPWGFHLMDPTDFEAPEEALQSLKQAPPLLNYVPGPEHSPSLDYMPGPEYPPSPDYMHDDDEEEEEESSEDDDKEDEDEEEEHLTLTDSAAATPPPRSPWTKVPLSQIRLRDCQTPATYGSIY